MSIAEKTIPTVSEADTSHKKKENKPKKPVLSIILPLCIALVGILCFLAARWYISVYGDIGFDSILYTMSFYLGGVKPELVMEFIYAVVLPTIVLAVAIGFVLFFLARKAHNSNRGKLFTWLSVIISAVIAITLIAIAAEKVGLREYIDGKLHPSALYEERYIDPNSVEISFPEEKRNVIFILLESMETAYFSKEHGGSSYTELIPELYALAEQNVNFSQNDGVGGFRSVGGTTWTIGAMVGQTSGVPLITPDSVSNWQNGYGKEGEFLPGLTTMQDILHENGYYQALMVGSNAEFGGRETYFQTHGTDRIYELSTAREDGIVPEDYYVWWGMEDKYLFQYAKQELLRISEADQPFAFTMLTVDTHHVDGYFCDLCDDAHKEQYQNVISCSSKQLHSFIEWIKQQDFYENTTIVITGDHPSMDAAYFRRNVSNDYQRRCYNCIINPALEPLSSKNREFSTLDMFPTILASMGCTIEGDRLGLGTNLFSNTPTLMEEMGPDTFLAQVGRSSDYYSKNFRNEEIEE